MIFKKPSTASRLCPSIDRDLPLPKYSDFISRLKVTYILSE